MQGKGPGAGYAEMNSRRSRVPRSRGPGSKKNHEEETFKTGGPSSAAAKLRRVEAGGTWDRYSRIPYSLAFSSL